MQWCGDGGQGSPKDDDCLLVLKAVQGLARHTPWAALHASARHLKSVTTLPGNLPRRGNFLQLGPHSEFGNHVCQENKIPQNHLSLRERILVLISLYQPGVSWPGQAPLSNSGKEITPLVALSFELSTASQRSTLKMLLDIWEMATWQELTP